MKVNLGCGSDIRSDMVNVNYFDGVGVDVVHNLNVFPYPFKKDSVDLIVMFHVLEHLDKVDLVLNECHRILKSDGGLHLKVPCKKYDTVLIHLHVFDEFSLDPFIVGKNGGMKGVQDVFLFKEIVPVKVNRMIHFRSRFLRRLGFPCGVNADSFRKYLGLVVNSDHSFGNYVELEWKLVKNVF